MKKALLSIMDAWYEARNAYAKRHLSHRLGS
jgi:hypothetical protein